MAGGRGGTPLESDKGLAAADDPDLIPDGEDSDPKHGERGAEADVRTTDGPSLVERLRARAHVWEANTDDKFVLRTLRHGLELPFAGGRAPPQPHYNARNFVDAQDVAWVRQAVNDLVATGAAKPWAEARQELEAKGISAGNRPFFVMPIGAL